MPYFAATGRDLQDIEHSLISGLNGKARSRAVRSGRLRAVGRQRAPAKEVAGLRAAFI